MPIAINGTGTITGISAGGLPDGVITTDDLAALAVTTAKLDNLAVTDAKMATAVKSLGVSQTWTDVSASRVATTNYTNSTGRPILVLVSIRSTSSTASRNSSFLVDGVAVSDATATASNGTNWGPIIAVHSVIVPDGSTYQATATASPQIINWFELR